MNRKCDAFCFPALLSVDKLRTNQNYKENSGCQVERCFSTV